MVLCPPLTTAAINCISSITQIRWWWCIGLDLIQHLCGHNIVKLLLIQFPFLQPTLMPPLLTNTSGGWALFVFVLITIFMNWTIIQKIRVNPKHIKPLCFVAFISNIHTSCNNCTPNPTVITESLKFSIYILLIKFPFLAYSI